MKAGWLLSCSARRGGQKSYCTTRVVSQLAVMESGRNIDGGGENAAEKVRKGRNLQRRDVQPSQVVSSFFYQPSSCLPLSHPTRTLRILCPPPALHGCALPWSHTALFFRWTILPLTRISISLLTLDYLTVRCGWGSGRPAPGAGRREDDACPA
jgi:hypothetical protein